MATATVTKTRFQVRQEERQARVDDYARKSKNTTTKRVELRTSLAGKPTAREGDVISLPAFEAEAFIAKGYAQEDRS